MSSYRDASSYKGKLVENVLDAIMEAGKVENSSQIVIDNGAVIAALVEVMAYFSAMHSFDTYTPKQLADKVGADLQRSIARHQHNQKAVY